MKRLLHRVSLTLLLILVLSPLPGQAQHMVKDINPGSSDSRPGGFVEYGGMLFFAAYDETHGSALWVTDGTESGTYLVKDINPASRLSAIDGLTEAEGMLFFSAFDGTHGEELWVSDGTEAGTHLVKDIWPGSENSYPNWLAEYGEKLFFSANDGTHGFELWISDGTEAGTHLFKDIIPDTTGYTRSDPSGFVEYGGKLFFNAYDGMHGRELWVSDGTEAGTRLFKDINPGGAFSYPGELVEYGGMLFFSASTGIRDTELWISDGTEAGTKLFKDIWQGAEGSNPHSLTRYGGKLFFGARDETHSFELWITDGTETGTHLVKDINPGPESSGLYYLTEAGGKLYFSAHDGVHGWDLWASDGTEAGTYLVKDIWPGGDWPSSEASVDDLIEVGGRVYFRANDGIHGIELWGSDGTEAGTRLVKDINPGPESSEPGTFSGLGFIEYDGKLFFAADDGTHGRELWVYDPSAPPADTTPPTCGNPQLNAGPLADHTAVFITAADPESGLASLTYDLTNAHGFYDAGSGTQGPFPDGHTEALTNVTLLTVGAEKIDPAERSRIVVRVTNGAGLSRTCDPVLTTLEGEQPLAYELDQNYPNPFNPSTTIPFAVPEAAAVRVVVYDVLGRVVTTLVEEQVEAGRYAAEWDGRDGQGRVMPSGVYMVRMEAGSFIETRRMTLVK